MEVSLELDGRRELEQALLRLTRDLRGEIVTEAILAAGEPIQREAMARAPRGKTGNLAGSIVVEAGSRYIHSVRIGTGAKGPHGHLIEFGTAKRVTKKGANRGQIAAKPFLKPALDAKKSEARAKFSEIIRARLELT